MESLPTISGYLIEQLIGVGGYGEVYRAVKLSTNQKVALKIIKTIGSTKKCQRKIDRFKQETQICSQLYHPHIVKLVDTGSTEDGDLYAEYEYIPGITLAKYLDENGALKADKVALLMGQVLDALCCAHSRGIVHRDLKPQNIIITQTGKYAHIKVLDFGIGTYASEVNSDHNSHITLTNETVGTPSYCAPEQLRGDPPTVKSDLYSWGLVLLECLLGHPVIQGETLAEIYHQQLSSTEVPIPPSIAIHPLGNLLRRVLHKRLEERAPRADIIYNDFRAMNLSNLVGKIHSSQPKGTTYIQENTSPQSTQDTLEGGIDAFFLKGERQQITTLCCKVRLININERNDEFELLDTLSEDIKKQCLETSLIHGGCHIGSLSESILIAFGYPYVSDDDAQRASRAAIKIIKRMHITGENIKNKGSFKLDIGIGIHTGMVLVKKSQKPNGSNIDYAFRLSQFAKNYSILVSRDTHRILSNNFNFGPIQEYFIDSSESNKLLATCLLPSKSHHYNNHNIRHKFMGTLFSQQSLIGRQNELNQLTHAQENAKNGKGSSILIQGEPGIGKSRLIYEFSQQAHSLDTPVLHGTCLPEFRNSALTPIFMLLKSLFGISKHENDLDAAKKINAKLLESAIETSIALPIICSWMSIIPHSYVKPIPYPPKKQKKILFSLIKKLLFHSPIHQIILIEDLQLADPTSLELLGEIIESKEPTNTLTILTAQNHFRFPWVTIQHQTITLSPLCRGDTVKLIHAIIQPYRLSNNAINTLIQRIDGIPLFAEELISMLVDKKILVPHESELKLIDNLDKQDIPITLKDSLNHRLQSSGGAKETAQIAATLGREFTTSLLSKVTIRSQKSIHHDLIKLQELNLINTCQYEDTERFIFRHALIRDAAYESLRLADRKSIHKRVATILEENLNDKDILTETNPYSQISLHYALADEIEKAIHYCINASKNALEHLQLEETINEGEKVLKWIKENSPDHQTQLELNVYRILMQAYMAKNG